MALLSIKVRNSSAVLRSTTDLPSTNLPRLLVVRRVSPLISRQVSVVLTVCMIAAQVLASLILSTSQRAVDAIVAIPGCCQWHGYSLMTMSSTPQ